MKFQLVIIAAILLSQMCEMKSVAVEPIANEADMNDVDNLDKKASSTRTYLEQLNACIGICYECFKEYLTLSEDNVIRNLVLEKFFFTKILILK